MKRIVSVILVIGMILCFAACDSGFGGSGKGGGPVISLYADKKAVAPGDELVLYVNVSEAEYVACFDVFITTEAELEYVGNESLAGEAGFIIECNKQPVDGIEGYLVAGMHMYACSLENDDILSITFKVPEDAKTGSSIKFNVECQSFDVSSDESGNDIFSVLDTVETNAISVKTAKESVAAEERQTSAVETTAEETTEEVTTEASTAEITDEAETDEISEEASGEVTGEEAEELTEEETTEEIIEE